MSNRTNPTIVVAPSSSVISDAREEEIVQVFKALHTKVVQVLKEVDVKPLFNPKWEECRREDYRSLHQQARALISAKVEDRTNRRIAGVRSRVLDVIEAYMAKARVAKMQYDSFKATMGEEGAMLPPFSNNVKVPLSEIRACFPANTSDAQLLNDLDYMEFKVTDMTPKGMVIVPFVPEAKPEAKAMLDLELAR